MNLFPGIKKILASTAILVLILLIALSPSIELMSVSAATYSVGSKGSAIITLHEKLITLGYMGANTSGTYSSTTKAAVKKFQKAYSLDVDGIAGPKTLAKLNSVYSEKIKRSGTVTVTGSNVNLRSGPGTRYGKLSVAKKGTSYTLTGAAKANNAVTWYRITVGSKTMWICGSYASVKSTGSTSTSTSTSTTSSGNIVTVTGSSVNLRSGPGTSYSKLSIAYKNQTFPLLGSGKASNGVVWYKINKSGTTMWICGTYAKVTYKTSSTTAAVNYTKVIITGSSVNVRSGAGTSYSKIGSATKNSSYKYLGSAKDSGGTVWYKIQYTSSKAGWVCGTYAKLQQPAATTTSTTKSTTTTTAATTAATTTTTTSPTTAPSATKYLSRTLTVSVTSANIRSDAGSSYSLLGTAAKGTVYTALDSKNDSSGITWFKINYNGRYGWVIRTSVTIKNNYTAIPDRDFSSATPVIYLSPSRQGANPYCIGSTSEKEQMEKLAVKIKSILDSEYNCITYIAATELRLDDQERTLDALSKNADVYLAIHSNASSGSSIESGASTYYFPACNQSVKLAENIVSELNAIAPLPCTLSDQTIDGMLFVNNIGYAEVRDPSAYGMVGVLAETDFHDNSTTASWLINNQDQIARAYVNALVDTFGISAK